MEGVSEKVGAKVGLFCRETTILWQTDNWLSQNRTETGVSVGASVSEVEVVGLT